MTQIEVSSEIGISQAQVSRLEKGALDHIKIKYEVLYNCGQKNPRQALSGADFCVYVIIMK